MKYIAEINIMPQKALLDPQGKAVLSSANKNGFINITNVRIGKNIEIEIEAGNKNDAAQIIDDLCKQILINPVIESYKFNIIEI
ncbi:MAG: phosphoribosylformylglycinamidine synthase subunit PurS [Bacteroidales bacterium]|jgi:phosphoribosylformylglycinamidine synthase|nr:phosphoribosylformylglycinamidine synthase subunit PurS [Bacteroidales bacterium]